MASGHRSRVTASWFARSESAARATASSFPNNEFLPLSNTLESVKTEPQITTDKYFLNTYEDLVKIYNHTLEAQTNIKTKTNSKNRQA